MIRLCLIGEHIAQSPSPKIHQLFAKQCAVSLEYTLQPTSVSQFHETVMELCEKGYRGCNITAPFKEQAYLLANECSSAAQEAKAANTFLFHEGKIFADNTDGLGFIRDVEKNICYAIKEKSILLCGAGGAARGILPALLRAGPASVTIANRSLIKAEQLAKEYKQIFSVPIRVIADEQLEGRFNALIDCTSCYENELTCLRNINIDSKGLVYDLKYRENTPTLAWAKKQSIESFRNGWGMLVEQAAESFALWTNQRPSTSFFLNIKIGEGYNDDNNIREL